MTRAQTTETLFQDEDFAVFKTDMPGVRIGMIAGTWYDIPSGHAWHDRVAEATVRVEVETLFDELHEAMS